MTNLAKRNRPVDKKFKINDTCFKNVIETMEDYAIFMIDNDGIIRTWTKAAEKIKGYKAKEIIGQHYRVLYPDGSQHLADEHLKIVKQNGLYKEKGWRKKKNGHLFWANVQLSPVRDENGTLIGFAKITHDITAEKLAEHALQESEIRFRSIADTVPMYISITDETGNAVYFNKPWLEFTGKKMKEMQGLSWLSTLYPEDASKFEKEFKHAFKNKVPISKQYRFKRADGKYRWMLVGGTPRFTPDGMFIGYYSTYTDFHELKKAQLALKESEKRFRVVSDNATTGLFIMDAKQHCTFMNPAAEKITGYTFAEIKKAKKPLHEIIHCKKPDGLNYPMEQCPIDRALPEENQTQGEDAFIRPDGMFYPVAFTASPIPNDGKAVGTVIEVRDITKEKKVDERRKQLERQKDEFLGIASHELKTPVTSIKAYGQVLEKMFRRKGDIRTAEYIAKMDAQIDRLSMLIGDLLDVTKIQSGHLQFNVVYFDFNELVNEITNDLQLTTDRHTLVKELDVTRSICGDRERIGQVLSNLISNAITFSPHAKKIIISTQVKKEAIQLCVQDFGVGIAKNKQDKVFEQFYRVSGEDGITFPGLGIGLYISKEIIKRLGGRLWVESVHGIGSTFCFTLPLSNMSD